MSDPFDLPEREMPDHVRQVALLRVLEGIDRTPPRRKTGMAPLLIAASVIALMAGATIVTSALNNKDSKPLTAAPTSPHPTTTITGAPENGFSFYGAQRNWGSGTEMERCWNAEHKPDTWSPLLRVNRNGLTALLYRVGTDLVFCELTKENVTVRAQQYPDPPTGNQPARLMFITQDGTYAGVTAPGVTSLLVSSGNVDAAEQAAVGDGTFILPNSNPPTDRIRLRGFRTPDYDVPKPDLPQVLAPTTTANDPKADRSSDAGQRVGSCVAAKTDRPLPDPDYWQPAAFLTIDATHWIQLATLNDGLLMCQQTGPGKFEVVGAQFDNDASLSAGGFTKIVTYAAGTGAAYVGFVSKPNATTVLVDPPGAGELAGTVENGTVIVYYPAQHGPISGSRVKVKDAAGNVIDQLTVG